MFLRLTVGFCAILTAASAEDWRMYLHDPAHSSLNGHESQIDTVNVHRLGQRWTVSLGKGLAAAATLVDGVLFFGDWDGNFYAMRASDGGIRWQRWVGKASDPQASECQPAIGVTSQAVVVGETVYVGGGDSAVYAMNRGSGELVWRLPLADPASGAYLWSSVLAAGNVLYIGIASLGDCPLVRGGLARIDLDNPTHPVIRYLTDEENAGAGVWSTPALDETTGTVYVTTGTGSQDSQAGVWGGTLLALDAKTLENKAYFFLPTNSLEDDIEWGSSPTLLTTSDGTRLVAATGKDAILYVLNADDLSLRWTLKLGISCICPECGCGSLSTPAFDGKYLYVGAGSPDPEGFADGSVYAVDAMTGQTAWRQDLIAPVIAPVTVANGVVFASSLTGAVGFDGATGAWLWDDGGYGVIYSQPVVADGVVYTTYLNGDVVAWALVGADAANSGRAPSILRNGNNHGVKLGPAFRRIQPHR